MLLQQITHVHITESVQDLEDKLQDAKTELIQLRQLAASTQQSGKLSQYNDQLTRAKAAVAAATEELDASYGRQGRESSIRSANQQIALARSKETPEQKQERLRKSHAAGHAASHRAGDMATKAKMCTDIYTELSNFGANVVKAAHVAEKAAKIIGVTERQIYLWLQKQDEFKPLARKLGLRR